MSQIVTIGKRPWLAGMSWASYEVLPDKNELLDDARRMTSSPSWFALRIGDEAFQAGFSDAILNAKRPPKMGSLAAMLADSKVQPWYGCFQITDELFWYIAVRDGNAILPDGDVIGSREDIDAARQRHATFNDWKNIVEGDFALLERMLKSSDSKPTWVRSLHRNKVSVAVMIAASVFATGIVAGIWQWQEHKAQAERLHLQLVQNMRMQELAKPAKVLTAKEMLATMPRPSLLLSVCRDALYPLSLSLYGWQLDTVECHVTSAVAHWRRGDGATVAKRPTGTLLASDNAVEQFIPFKFSNNHSSEQPVALSAAREALRAWTQARGFTLRMEQTATQPLLPGAKPDNLAIPLTAINQPIAIDMPSPFSSGADFDAIPGLRLTSMKTLPDGLWSIQGVIYGR